MKKIASIFINDIKKISKNIIAIIIVGGLLILPSLYAWINIYASWDPYGNTGGIEIVVCNQDEGGKIKDTQFNVGESLIEKLRENTALGWTFVEDEDEAIELTEVGEVYATIVIPKDFSKKLATIITENPMKPSLEYYINEKVNAIAPKITDKGASTLQSQISTTFVETVTTECFKILNEAGVQTEEMTPTVDVYKKYLDKTIETIPTIVERLQSTSKTVEQGSDLTGLASEDIALVDNLLNDLVTFTNDFQKDIDNLNGESDEISQEITDKLNTTKIHLQDVDGNVVKLRDEIVLEKPNVVSELRTSSADLKVLVNKIDTLQRDLLEYEEDVLSPAVADLAKTTDEQLTQLEKLLDDASDVDFYQETIKITEPIQELTASTRVNLTNLNSLIEDESKTVNTKSVYIDLISEDLTDLLLELEGKTENTEKAAEISATMLPVVEKLKSEIVFHQSPLYTTLESIESSVANLDNKVLFDGAVSDLQSDKQVIDEYQSIYSSLNDLLEQSDIMIDNTQDALDTIDETCTTINEDAKEFNVTYQYYITNSQKDVAEMHSNLSSIYSLTMEQKNYLIPEIKEVTDMSLARMDNIADILNNLADDIENGEAETTLDDIHRSILDTISTLDNLIVKINTDITSTVQRYLSNAYNFTADANILLVRITEKTELLQEFTNNIADNGQVTADDMLEISEVLPELQKDLEALSTKLENASVRAKIEELLDNVGPNEDTLTDFIAYPVDLNSHYLYSAEFYGYSMTPFYTTLSLWVGVLILASLLTTESKNVDFEPTPKQTYLGKYPLFLMLAIIQGLIVALGDIFLLKVVTAEPVLFVSLTMYQSLVFCTILYALLALFGNVGKAIGVILLVLQVAGSGGTFPIQMTPPFFQRLYSWLPFTYGIGALREAVFGVYYPALRKDIIILALYPIIFFTIGLVFVSVNHEPLERIAQKLKESGVSE